MAFTNGEDSAWVWCRMDTPAVFARAVTGRDLSRRHPETRQVTSSFRLRERTKRYLETIAGIPLHKLPRTAGGPRITIPFGAAGLAYAHVHAHDSHDDSHDSHDSRGSLGSLGSLDEAARWINVARRASCDWDPAREIASDASLFYGRDGILLAGILVAAARGRWRTVERLRSELETALRNAEEATQQQGRGGPAAIFDGAAGYVAALVTASRRIGDPKLGALAEPIAAGLLRSVSEWSRLEDDGFAHGRSGIVFALLRWSLLSREPIPDVVLRELERLARAPTPIFERERERWPGASASLCAGATGRALLWSCAYACTKDPSYVSLASEAAEIVARAPDHGLVDLCCGVAGRTYALWSIDRIAPGKGWNDRASALADSAASIPVGSRPHGLLKGYAGLVCLAADVQRKRPRGFPLLEDDH